MTTPITATPLFVQWLKKEVAPALGCTEPVAIAYAAAYAQRCLGEPVETISGAISENLYKNAMGVTIPGTACCGVNLAAAIGALGGDASRGLETLKGIGDACVEQAKTMVACGRVNIGAADTEDFIHLDLTLRSQHSECRIVVNGSHTNVTELYLNGEAVAVAQPRGQEDAAGELPPFTLREAFDYVNQAPFDELAFILQAAEINGTLSTVGKAQPYGLNINQTLSAAIDEGMMSDSLMTRVLIDTVAASDARMGGAPVPAMSNFGSGNQGIAATLPVVAVARHLKVNDDQLARALALSHLVAISIHARYTRLSAMCAASTAAMGSAAGMAWLFTHSFQAIGQAITNMISDVSGIICDGASNSCAMKVSTTTMSAFKSVLMARQNHCAGENDGIVAHDVEDSIQNLCRLVIKPMRFTDKEIISIMTQK
ncbi:serine dehydratase subunit alpha family protein [Edwardsiella piscicida]|uniref:L-cysteine desulfidase family protein n=1 Tax=Edwardsiella piscicida TaxID=1263550 RepID=UPI00084C999F|nr:L-serine ammonia-lyase, iron-sulfur-dependent, subunit alpha [Edwardsiella piscicida]AOP43991.1 L-serine ammonia-lyase, iron-sulfur-dependent, subunit alpha [Edwardsiella piscicida]EKS7766300.1 serine dehydratase subunit alpha family protein [Edwardsiella piscicida]UCQ30601.1 L-serine ammonia-lyase, iron-sulfur-dependent, subunit alpha [Edwardsiella piscicida]UCQ56928.1 L-serine ammonia-lyase, iron-sulfur-dependent, subunit alpha [Edwardsiella piscicida]WAM44019.1 L-serine ammonia-lyase, ir